MNDARVISEPLPLMNLWPREPQLHRRFFLTAMIVMLTAGAAWGVWLLLKIGHGESFTGIRVHEVNAHGHAQIMGWVGLFIMGFAYQMFPRLWHTTLPAARLAGVVWATVLLSMIARSAAMVSYQADWALPTHNIAGGVQTIAVVIFIAHLIVTFRRGRHPWEPSVGFIFAALTFFVIQTIASSWHVSQLMAAADRPALLKQIATYQAPLRDLQIHGMAMLMIFGVSIRLFPVFFGLPQTSDRRGWAALIILLIAIVLEVGLFLAFGWTGQRAYAAAILLPWLMLLTGAGLIAMPWRLWRTLPEPGRSDRSGKFIRIAFAWLFVALMMLLCLPVYQLISDIAFSHAYYGAVRHAITVGFVSMMIVGMAAKVVPMLRGVPVDTLPALWLPFVLINLGCLLRVAFQIGTDWHPMFFQIIGVSGALEWLGLAIWAGHLARIMFTTRR